MEHIQEPSVALTYFTDKKTDPMLQFDHLIYPVLDKLECKNYSEKIEGFLVIIVAFSDKTFPEEDKMRYRPKKKEIEIRINVDFEELKTAHESKTTLKLIAETYLLAIERFLSQRKDFDSNRFYQDVKMLFTENGFL